MTKKRYSNGPEYRQNIKNILTIWINRIVAIIFPLVTTPIIVNGFSPELVAVWFYVNQWVIQLTVLDGGITNALTRLLADSSFSDLQKKSLFASSFIFIVVIALLLVLLSPLVSVLLLENVEDISSDNLLIAKSFLNFAIIITAVGLVLRLGYSVLAAKHRFDIYQWADVASLSAKFLLIIIVFKVIEPHFLVLGFGIYIIQFIMITFIFFKALKIYGFYIKDFTLSYFSLLSLRTVFSISLAMVLMSLGGVLLNQGGTLLSAHLLGVKSVTLIAIAFMVYVSITPFFQVFATVVAPIAAGVKGSKDIENLRKDFTNTSSVLMFVGLTVSAFFIFYGEFFLDFWLSGDNINGDDVSTINKMLIVLLLGYSLGIAASIGKSILSSVGQHWSVGSIELITAVLALGVGAWIAKSQDYGVLGFPLAAAGAFFIRGAVIYPYMLAKYFQMPVLMLLYFLLKMPLLFTSISVVMFFFFEFFSRFLGVSHNDWLFIVFFFIQALWFWLFFIGDGMKLKIAKVLQ